MQICSVLVLTRALTVVRMVDTITANQLVAYNLQRARRLQEWTQAETVAELAKVGRPWSTAVYSAAERSIDGGRIRQFDADDLLAFSDAFGLPVTFFLLPPGADLPAKVAPGPDLKGLDAGMHLRQLFARGLPRLGTDLAARFEKAPTRQRLAVSRELRRFLYGWILEVAGKVLWDPAEGNYGGTLRILAQYWEESEALRLQLLGGEEL